MKTPTFARALLVGTCLWLSSAPVWAQPQASPPQLRGQWLQLRRTWSATELADPQSAIDAYQKFYHSLGSENGEVAVEVVSRMAQLYGGELGERDRALQLYEVAMQRWRAPELLGRLLREHDKMSGLEQNETAPVTSTPLTPAQEVVPLGLQAASDARTKAGTLVELLAAGQDAESVWASGEWDVKDVLWALEHIITDDGILRGRPREGEKMREALAGLLARHGGALVSGEGWRALPIKARLWLGDYYRRKNEDKAVAVLENVVSELEAREARSGGDKSVFFAGVERLAQIYEGKAQPELTAQTWMRLLPLLDKTDWRVPDALIGAARAYSAMRQSEKANALYAQVPQYGHGWLTGLAFYDQFLSLVAEKKYSQARALIDQPVTGNGAEQAKVLLLSASGQLHYIAGEWLEAKKESEATISVFESLKPEQRRPGFDTLINIAQARLIMSQQWLKQPLRVEQSEIRVKTHRSENAQPPILEKVYVRSPEDALLQVSVNNDKIKAYFSGFKTDKSVNSYYFQQEIIVEIPANSMSDIDAQLTIKSVSPSETTIKLPIFVEAEAPIRPSVSSIFFGTVNTGQPVTRLVSLSSPMPFRILQVESDNAAMKVEMVEPKTNKEQTLQATLTPPQAGQFYAGTLHITTDVVGQKVIEVPYAAQSK